MQHVSIHGERDIKPGICQMIDAVGLVLASGTARILAQNFDKTFELRCLRKRYKTRAQLIGKSTSSSCQGASSIHPPVASGWQSAKGI